MKFICLIALLLVLNLNLNAQAKIPEDYKLVYAQDFEQPQAITDFEMSDETAWKINEDKGNKCIELFDKSEYEPIVRSPFNMAVLKGVILSDFVLEIKLNQNGREYGHRDLCLMFGINNPSNFYYTHIASKSDAYANSIFIVNDEPRVSIVSQRTDGTNWGAVDSWHTVRVVRKVEEGIIEIYFDDMVKPIMTAVDTHFKSGYIGFGSFDDTGKFDAIKIWAPKILEKKSRFFK
ncbi:hypothetical protein [Seonamhaeicola sp. ML3]|uniref:hypothetical protein n=1 Tax=Seonamhaeicola sp. ML3 TaxID=2937786 RepID=UPI00200D7553|nr:hypothetical protein [Seonamhaeicola sp. ML3]